MTTSLQLPDLLSICNVFELRTNRHCRRVSQASEEWLLGSGLTLSGSESASMAWSAAKLGLLAAACHPSADATQLRFVADFFGLLLYRHHRKRGVAEEDDNDVFALLSDRLSRSACRHPGWYARFVKSQRLYHAARAQLSENGARGVVPDLESYVELRRDASGLRMALDMVQYAGDVGVSEAVLEDALVARLHDRASDIAAWSVDIVSCARGIPPSDAANIVTILMRERNVSLESAVMLAGTLVQQSVDAFVAGEAALLSVPALAADREVRRYVRGLRDWIAGFVNWLYETELFLGGKGSEVRAFGWVFIPVSP